MALFPYGHRGARAATAGWRAAALAFLCIGASGCAETWVKPGATPQQFVYAKADCDQRGIFRFSPDLKVIKVAEGYTAPASTTCTHHKRKTSCTTVGEHWVEPVYAEYDFNDDNREGMVRSCLFAKGWVPEQRR